MEMLKHQKIYDFLICLTIVSFGFFGSLSHIFSLALIILTLVSHKISKQKNRTEFKAFLIYLALSGCFFVFILTSISRSNFGLLLDSLSPMLPLPLIGLLIIFHSKTNFQLTSKKVSQFSKLSILFSLAVYVFFLNFTDPNSIYQIFYEGRLEMFSGNPIPFSFAILGVSVFCLADWKNSSIKNKLTAFILFLTGAYFAGYLSGSRGTLLTIIIISPIIIFYLSNNFKISIFVFSILILLVLFLIKSGLINNLGHDFFSRITNGLETIILMKNIDSSIFHRIEMWSAAIKAISDNAIAGYGITERFSAIKPYLTSVTHNYTHPHNDTLAGFITSGIIGGIATTISIISASVAALVAKQRSIEKILLGLMISISTFINANVSTVFFNDISSAWLAFSTYLIWSMNFRDTSTYKI